MANKYNAKDVRVLQEVEHIRLNPSMYIGDTSNPAHLIEEALDNALDEALAGFATIIAVNIDLDDNVYAVIDNGRGIPIENNTPVTVSSKLFSGAKFQDKKTAYEISSGLHGVGLVAVNALSDFYNLQVYRDSKFANYNFINTKLKRKRVVSYDKEIPFSTKVEFKPSKKIFESIEPDINRIRRRLITASAQMTKVVFALNIKKNDEIDKEVVNLSLGDHFKQNCLTTDEEPPVFHLFSEPKPESFNVIFSYEEKGPITPRILSSVNLLPVDGGGTHVNFFLDTLKEFFEIKAKKNGFKFQPKDCLIGLRAFLMLNLKEPKFAGQTKEKLTNRKSEFEKFKTLRSQLEKLFEKESEHFISYLERFDEYRKKLDSKTLVKNGTKGKRVSTKFTKLRDCTNRNGELFVVEGDSAGGSIIMARNPKIHAVLPLKGKSIPNITSKKDILKNKEVGELIRAIGTGVGPHFNLKSLRYSKIICATDADHDGAHIACLLTMVMAVLLPDVVKAGHYYIAQTPLFAINEKKKFIPLWSEEDLKKARRQKKSISRFKGLGELSPAQMKICLLEHKTRNLMQVRYSEDMKSLSKIFSNVDAKRTLLEE